MTRTSRSNQNGPRPSTKRKPVGRPKGEEETVVIAVRIPVSMLARLDRYLDRLESQHGLKANRASVTRRGLEKFLDEVKAE